MTISLRVLTISLFACSVPEGAAVRIGALYCDSGARAILDKPCWRGAQLAVAEVNKAGGIRGEQVELVRIAGNLHCRRPKKCGLIFGEKATRWHGGSPLVHRSRAGSGSSSIKAGYSFCDFWLLLAEAVGSPRQVFLHGLLWR
jgi:hypothetical protein